MRKYRFLFLLLVIFLLVITFLFYRQYSTSPASKTSSPQTKSLNAEEKKQIDDWILKENRNLYGDTADTVYIGGTPLFNESTGETIDRYEYVLKNHPDRPWKK